MGTIFMKFLQLLDECLHHTNVLNNVDSCPNNQNNLNNQLNYIISPKKKKKINIDSDEFSIKED
jgi:hypothetical protein